MSELSEAISEMRSMRESYDQISTAAEAYNTGKIELAANITTKGIPASATETLPELAEKVGAIAQTQTILEGGEVMAAQQFGDGTLWNLYQVLADMKTRFMGNGDYSALIVCEYYKGYDSLQLQGADAYYTCDGDLYEYASPNHIWHDFYNGKANRWVAFLYRDAGARLDITNTAISPRSMYIGGHIGTIEYFVNGRLTDLVCGVEETDIIDNFILNNHTQEWSRNVVLRNIGTLNDAITINSNGAFVCDAKSAIRVSSARQQWKITSASSVYLNFLKVFGNGYNAEINANSAIIFYAPLLERVIAVAADTFLQFSGTSSYAMQLLYMPSLTSINCYVFSNVTYGVPRSLVDVWVGALTTNLNMKGWNPTNVLADADKKAQLIDNIKNHILARVSDRTGLSQLTFTVSTNMFNAISGETITWNDEQMTLADAFLTKNWLLAGA